MWYNWSNRQHWFNSKVTIRNWLHLGKSGHLIHHFRLFLSTGPSTWSPIPLLQPLSLLLVHKGPPLGRYLNSSDVLFWFWLAVLLKLREACFMFSWTLLFLDFFHFGDIESSGYLSCNVFATAGPWHLGSPAPHTCSAWPCASHSACWGFPWP